MERITRRQEYKGMIHYLKLAVPTDRNRLRQELDNIRSQQWPLHYQTRHFEGEWSALSLRSTDGRPDNPLISPDDKASYQDTILLQQSPYIKELLGFFQCPLQAVRLLKLTPGSVIKEHKDADLCFEKGAARIHIPVITNPDVEFIVDGEPLRMNEGECWYCNFNRPHSLANRGKTDRIHLVIDTLVNDWLTALFTGDKVLLKKESPGQEEEQPDPQIMQEMIFHFRAMNTPTGHQLADELEAKWRAATGA